MPTSQFQTRPASRSSTDKHGKRRPSDDRPDAEQLLEAIHEHTRAGRIRAAQRLVREAAAEFPDDADVRKASRILTGEQVTPRPGTGRSLREEYEWLCNPPAEYRGRCVALIGTKVVAVADTLEDLRESLPSHLEQIPLAVQIAA